MGKYCFTMFFNREVQLFSFQVYLSLRGKESGRKREDRMERIERTEEEGEGTFLFIGPLW